MYVLILINNFLVFSFFNVLNLLRDVDEAMTPACEYDLQIKFNHTEFLVKFQKNLIIQIINWKSKIF